MPKGLMKESANMLMCYFKGGLKGLFSYQRLLKKTMII